MTRRDEGDENTANGGFAAGITNVIMLVGEIYSLFWHYRRENSGGQNLYAYDRQPQRRSSANLYVVPDRQRVRYSYSAPQRQIKKVKKKKVNPFLYFFRLFVVLSIFSLYSYFVFPTAFRNLIKNVIFPYNIKISTKMPEGLAYKDALKNIGAADLYAITNPTVEYLSNDLFLNRMLLVPTIQKTHSEVTTMYQTSEMAALKVELENLMKSYPAIHPAIYVWEYENGKYLDINADEQFSAASIIKLPVLVQMFKSIEAGQATIYDEMTLTDYYKAPGSGNLQYMSSGGRYSLDALAKTMIQDSDNSATNMIMSKIGGMDYINIGLRDWGISKTYVRTWLPDMTGTNKTTANDLAKILYNLDNPGFLNINSREYIIDYMSHVKNNKLIAAGLGEGALFAHKTGDIGSMLGDAGIVYAPNGKKYIIVILANRPYNSPQGKDFIVKASNLIYKSIVG